MEIKHQCRADIERMQNPVCMEGMRFGIENREVDALIKVELQYHLWKELEWSSKETLCLCNTVCELGGVSHHSCQIADLCS